MQGAALIYRYGRLGETEVSTATAIIATEAAAGYIEAQSLDADGALEEHERHGHVNIWPFVKAGVISGLTVYFLTKWLNGGKR
jgi:hypothetical protein